MKPYKKHIKDNRKGLEGFSLCGIYIMYKYAFQNIDHWYYSQINGDRLLACPKCLKKIKEVL